MVWLSFYDQVLTLNGSAETGHIPVILSNLTAKRLIFKTTNLAALPTWSLGCKIFTFQQITDLPGGAVEAEFLEGRSILNQAVIITPQFSPAVYKLRLLFPWWHEEIRLQIWREPVEDPINLAGTIQLFAAQTAPQGYLFCNGAAVNRTTYADLFAVIGTIYGSGNGSTTFNLPNFQGRVPMGAGTSVASGTVRQIGAVGGADSHQLTIGQMPVHSHTIKDGALDNVRSVLNGIQTNQSNYGNSNGLVNTAGNNEAHNNLQPFIALNYIIKF